MRAWATDHSNLLGKESYERFDTFREDAEDARRQR